MRKTEVDKMDEEQLIALLDSLLRQVAMSAEGADELLALWMNLGRKIGIQMFLPDMRAVVIKDEDNEERHLVAFVAGINEELAEYLSSLEVFNEDITEFCLKSKREEVYH